MSYFSKIGHLLGRPLLVLLLAVALTVALGVYLPPEIDAFNDSMFGDVTIMYKPELVEALNAAEDKGVVMAVHAWHHEDLRLADGETARDVVEKGVALFNEAGLTPAVWYTPYTRFSGLPDDVQDAITSVLPRRLPDIDIVDERGNGDDLLEQDEIWVYRSTYTVTRDMVESNGNGDPGDGKIHNTATVHCDQTEGDTAEFAIPVTQTSGLEVIITAGDVDMTVAAPDDRLDAGDTIPYTVLVYNTGSETLTNVAVGDLLPTGMRRDENDESGNEDDLLEEGEIWSYSGTYIVTQDMIDSNGNGDPSDGTIYNTASVRSDQTKGDTAVVGVPIAQAQGPCLDVVIVADDVDMTVVAPDDCVDEGDTISYTIKVCNTGHETLTNVSVGDSLMTTLERGTSLSTRGRSWGEYTFGFRDIESVDDPLYAAQKELIMRESPNFFMAHFYDWNSCTKQFVLEYLAETKETDIEIRVDDVEPNTPAWKVTDIAELLDSDKVIRVSFGVISEGTWIGGDPHISGASVNGIFHFYWAFFLAFAFFPFLVLVFWKVLSRNKKSNSGGGSPRSETGGGWKLTVSNSGDGSPSRGTGGEGKPTVSVIVPAYNEERYISACLEAIQKQDFGGNMEVIVVNDGSTDRTAEIASEYPVTLINLKTNTGKANALNTGIEESKGDILIFSDSDSEMAPDAVTLLVNRLGEDPEAGAVAGNVLVKRVKWKNTLLQYFQMIEYKVDQGLSRYLQGLSGNVLVCPGPLFAVRSEIAKKTMFSNRSVIEDADFTIEMLKSKVKVLHEPNAKVYTNAPRSLRAWRAQRKRWMYGSLQLWRIHKPWARRNPWMILSYSGYLTAIMSLVLMAILPFLFLTYDNFGLVLLRGMGYAIVPIILFALLIVPFFKRDVTLLLTIIPYIWLYGTLKALMLAYIYLRYAFDRGMVVRFGPGTQLVR